jgi:hypothetical protein
LSVAGVLLGLAGVLLALVFFADVRPIGTKLELYKLLVQFFLITGGGGALLVVIGNFRDEAIRRQGRAAAIYDLDRELDRAHRALKKAKRTLRAHRAHGCEAEVPGQSIATAQEECPIPSVAFEQAMEELLEAQLQLEGICDHIADRNDVLNRARLERMKAPLRYVSRYYHDVYQDYEQGRTTLRGGCYSLRGAPNLLDYLRRKQDGDPERTADLEDLLAVLIDKERGFEARGAALAVIEETRRGGDGRKPRYGDVAGACFELLSDELAKARSNLLSF